MQKRYCFSESEFLEIFSITVFLNFFQWYNSDEDLNWNLSGNILHKVFYPKSFFGKRIPDRTICHDFTRDQNFGVSPVVPWEGMDY